jgi:hypothetical protein
MFACSVAGHIELLYYCTKTHIGSLPPASAPRDHSKTPSQVPWGPIGPCPSVFSLPSTPSTHRRSNGTALLSFALANLSLAGLIPQILLTLLFSPPLVSQRGFGCFPKFGFPSLPRLPSFQIFQIRDPHNQAFASLHFWHNSMHWQLFWLGFFLFPAFQFLRLHMRNSFLKVLEDILPLLRGHS